MLMYIEEGQGTNWLLIQKHLQVDSNQRRRHSKDSWIAISKRISHSNIWKAWDKTANSIMKQHQDNRLSDWQAIRVAKENTREIFIVQE